VTNVDAVDVIVDYFGVYGPAHRCRLRPNMGSETNDQRNCSNNETLNATDVLNRGKNDIQLSIPFASKV
jgi:hypothetical protein